MNCTDYSFLEVNGGYQCGNCNNYHCPRCGTVISITSDESAIYCYDCDGYYDYIPPPVKASYIVRIDYLESGAYEYQMIDKPTPDQALDYAYDWLDYLDYPPRMVSIEWDNMLAREQQ